MRNDSIPIINDSLNIRIGVTTNRVCGLLTISVPQTNTFGFRNVQQLTHLMYMFYFVKANPDILIVVDTIVVFCVWIV